jgi:hypothetical protein
MKLLYHNSKILHGSPRSAGVRLPLTRSLLRALFHTVSDHRFLLPHARGPPSSSSVPTPANFNTPHLLHSICIRPASAAPAASF